MLLLDVVWVSGEKMKIRQWFSAFFVLTELNVA
jgi:hypothetical protein